MSCDTVRRGLWTIGMRDTHFLTVSVFVLSICAGLAMAQSDTSPAEIPPTSFEGRQFVDSQGCVFLRAGIDGNTYWVPRLNNVRKPICAQKPTVFEDQASQTVSVAPDVFAVVDIPVATNNVSDVNIESPSAYKEEAERTAGKVAPIVAPDPDSPVVAEQSTPLKPVSKTVDILAPVPKPTVQSRLKRQIDNREPQTSAIGTKTKELPKVDRAIPKQVAINQRTTRTVVAPKGDKQVLKNAELTAKRPDQTLTGHSKTTLIWTAKVPHRLINQANGEDMTRKLALVFPYTDSARQRRELGKVTIEHRDGQVIKRVKRRVAKAKPTAADQAANLPVDTARFVQVGAYAVPENAGRTALLLQENGLNVHFVLAGRYDQPLKLVLVGPFGSDQDARKALQTARKVGFHDAFVRK